MNTAHLAARFPAPVPVNPVAAELAAGRAVMMLSGPPQIVCAARGITAATINLMAQHARGLICHAMSADQMLRLGLSLLPSNSDRAGRWRFATSYEAAQGCTTGISAGERALTLNTGARAGAGWRDLAQPGHIIPVLGDPEGDMPPDLALRLMAEAGLQGGAAICSVLDEKGAVADSDSAVTLARALGLALAGPVCAA